MTRTGSGVLNVEGVAGHLPLEGVAAHAVAARGRLSPTQQALFMKMENQPVILHHALAIELKMKLNSHQRSGALFTSPHELRRPQASLPSL
ncbi:MAG: hypothetical protein B7Z37_24615 [Verrucomicrobia bacterium 12-59-8]|nr:MAG: hypothetical protein B7Z37_24615 [Verrucomicrobia bacterium 12-59-8]